MKSSRGVLTFRVDADYRRRLESEASARGVTLSAHIRTILMNHAERAELRNVVDALKLLHEKLQRVEGEVKGLRREFQEAVR